MLLLQQDNVRKMAHRYFIYLSYDGAAYHGWQVQPNGMSVQERLTQSISLLLRQEVKLTGAGRTDAGVNARLMVVHFDVEAAIDGPWLVDKLNRLLPQDIAVQQIREVKPDAHARFDALWREYQYFVVTRKDPFLRAYALRLYKEPNWELMNQAAGMLLEYTDFTSFSKLHTDVKTNNCRVMEARWTQISEGYWVFTIRADRFLRNMVRAIVGTLLQVGQGQLTLEGFRRVIEQKDRCSAGDSVEGKALFLTDIGYGMIEN